MNHILRVGGSVFESLILEWNSSFDISHLPSPEASVDNRKQKEWKRIWPLWGDACFHGDVEHVLVCMMTSRMHILLGSLLPLLPGCRQCAAHGAVTCQAWVYRRTLRSKREKSTGESQQLRFSEDSDRCDSLYFRFPSLNMAPGAAHAGHGMSKNLRSFSPDRKRKVWSIVTRGF